MFLERPQQSCERRHSHFYVRKSGMPNIIGVLAGLVSHGE
jgi:hypothetical protein